MRVWRWIAVGFVALLLLVAAAWWVARPTGNLRVAFAERLLDDDAVRNDALRLIDGALALQGEVRAAYARYSFLDPADLPDPLPLLPDPTGTRLRDVVTSFVVEAKGEAGPFGTVISVDGVRFLEALYSFSGFRDRYVVVRGLEDCPTTPPVGCRQLDIAIDVNASGVRLKGAGDEEITRELAVHLLRIFLAETEQQVAPTRPTLTPVRQTPSSLLSISFSVSGIERLEGRSTEDECVALAKRKECIAGAEGLLLQAIEEEKGNPLAHLGVGLVALRRAIDAAAGGDSGSLVEDAFVRAADHLRVAQLHSGFLAERLQNAEWLERFELLGLRTELDGDVADLARRFACTNAAHRRGYMAAVMSHADGLEKRLPASLVPYVLTPLYDARFYGVADNAALNALLAEAKDHFNDVPPKSELQRVIARHECRFVTTRERGRETLDQLLPQLEDLTARKRVELALLACDAADGAAELSRRAGVLRGRILTLTDVPERALLLLELGLLLADNGEADAALEVLGAAADVLPFAASRLIAEAPRSPGVATFVRDTERYEAVRSRSAAATGTDLYEDIPCQSPQS